MTTRVQHYKRSLFLQEYAEHKVEIKLMNWWWCLKMHVLFSRRYLTECPESSSSGSYLSWDPSVRRYLVGGSILWSWSCRSAGEASAFIVMVLSECLLLGPVLQYTLPSVYAVSIYAKTKLRGSYLGVLSLDLRGLGLRGWTYWPKRSLVLNKIGREVNLNNSFGTYFTLF